MADFSPKIGGDERDPEIRPVIPRCKKNKHQKDLSNDAEPPRRMLCSLIGGRVMAKSSISAIAANDGCLSKYLEDIKHHPMLQPQREFMLAARWREHGDRQAAHELVVSHLRLVVKI